MIFTICADLESVCKCVCVCLCAVFVSFVVMFVHIYACMCVCRRDVGGPENVRNVEGCNQNVPLCGQQKKQG